MSPGADSTPGDLVRSCRNQKHWSRRQLAIEMHKSVTWVAQLEQGVTPLGDIHVLGRLAVILGAPLPDFIAAALGPDAADAVRARPYVEALRQAIAERPVPGAAGPALPDAGAVIRLADVDDRKRRAWALLRASAYRDLGPLLAGLISDLEVASCRRSPAKRQRVLDALAEAYQMAAAMLVKVGDPGAGWVAADRAIAAGERCGDRALVLAGQLRMAHTLLGSKEKALARHGLARATQTAGDVAESNDLGLISLVGSCALLLGILDARDGKSRAAARDLRIASRLATRLGRDRNDYGTEFGPTNVAMHAVAIAVELGNGQQALDRAKQVNPEGLSPERQARFLVDVARAHVLTKSSRGAVLALLNAEQIARRGTTAHPAPFSITTSSDSGLALSPPAPPVPDGSKSRDHVDWSPEGQDPQSRQVPGR